MLVLGRKPNEQIKMSNGIVVTIIEVQGSNVRVGIEAPKHVAITRSEPCKICYSPTFDHYLGYRDIPFCGDPLCGRKIKANQGALVEEE